MDDVEETRIQLKTCCCCVFIASFLITLAAHHAPYNFFLNHALLFAMSMMSLFLISLLICSIVDHIYHSLYMAILRYKLKKLRRELEIELSTPEIIIVEDRDEICTICMERVGIRGKKLECGHYFHGDCISKWSKESDTCPNCRTLI